MRALNFGDINNLSNDTGGGAQTYSQVFTVRLLQLPQKFIFASINIFCIIILPSTECVQMVLSLQLTIYPDGRDRSFCSFHV